MNCGFCIYYVDAKIKCKAWLKLKQLWILFSNKEFLRQSELLTKNI